MIFEPSKMPKMAYFSELNLKTMGKFLFFQIFTPLSSPVNLLGIELLM
jgi:hypothetical protein